MPNQQDNFYVTSPIYYVNDVPHIGHAYTSIACDIIARFNRLNNNNTFFLTGTDEHGQKVEKSANLKGKDPQEFCDEVSKKFQELTKILQLSNDDFIRTTDDHHKNFAQKFWKKLEKNGFIYKGVYEGWYAIRDEAFYAEDELVNGRAPSGAEVEWQKQESYFFKLSAFEDKLLTLYEAAPDFIKPKSRFNEVVSFVKSGLKDLSISRNTFSWGVKVPADEKHVMYVWLDALTNYLSALDAENDSEKYQNFWKNTQYSPLHIVGKDIVRFHAIYWPAFLMAAQENLPYQIYAHGWWTNNGEKISKSLGNVIDPIKELQWLQALGCNENQALDYFRYFLFREVPFGNDGDYSRENFVTRVNAELANNIGNLTQRTLAMIYKNNGGKIVSYQDYQDGQNLLKDAYNLKENIQNLMQDLSFDKAIFLVLTHASKCNEFINDKQPWNLKKEGKIDEMNQVLSLLAENIRIIAVCLQPFCINLAPQMLELLNVKITDFSTLTKDHCLKEGHQINEPKALFPRLA
ncbi:MAG: methionine--tRNA ligase [Rickettsiales bacterium]|nr:methionine--tRNA ligase [Rickettsiales bacterium]